MTLIEVNIVGTKPLKRGINRLQDVFSREAAVVWSLANGRVHLGRQHVAVATSKELPQQTAGDLLANSARIDIGGIKEDDALVNRPSHNATCLAFVQHPGSPVARAKAHHAKADTGYF